MVRIAALLAGAFGYGVLVLLNVGGYRYGVSDQAFYIPVVMQQVTPTLFPHDASLIAAQDRFFAFDDWFAPLLALTGASLSTAFLVAYGVTLALLYGALVGLGRLFYTSWWAVIGLVVGLTMRHRIPDTAVNSLEGYFHPRLLTFALGLWAIVFFLRGRTWLAFVVVGVATLVHPTTALWFIMLVGSAALVSDRLHRTQLWVMAGLASLVVLFLLAGPLRGSLKPMDPVWVDVLSVKDYLDPFAWPASTWFSNLALAAVIGGVYLFRRRLGLVSSPETGLVAGCGALLLVFLVSAPLAHTQNALVVQLQISRVFWLFDVLASVYMGWLLIESPGWASASLSLSPSSSSSSSLPGTRTPSWAESVRTAPRWVVVAVLVTLALARGVYVTFVVPAGRPISTNDAAIRDWPVVMAWASEQPVGTHFLTDPGHANLYGSSVRVASGRDVYLEIVKDVGIAIYSADIAHRVRRRVDDLGHFATLSPERALRLADRYDLDFLITEQELALPEAKRTARFHVYDLSGIGTTSGRDQPQD